MAGLRRQVFSNRSFECLSLVSNKGSEIALRACPPLPLQQYSLIQLNISDCRSVYSLLGSVAYQWWDFGQGLQSLIRISVSNKNSLRMRSLLSTAHSYEPNVSKVCAVTQRFSPLSSSHCWVRWLSATECRASIGAKLCSRTLSNSRMIWLLCDVNWLLDLFGYQLVWSALSRSEQQSYNQWMIQSWSIADG